MLLLVDLIRDQRKDPFMTANLQKKNSASVVGRRSYLGNECNPLNTPKSLFFLALC